MKRKAKRTRKQALIAIKVPAAVKLAKRVTLIVKRLKMLKQS